MTRSIDTPVLELRDAYVRYRSPTHQVFEAVKNVSLDLCPAEIVGLVGESGCGKSTTARAMLGIQSLSAGSLHFRGQASTGRDREFRSSVQAIFQNPAGSFNPKRSILDSVAEPLRVWKRGDNTTRLRMAEAELDRVGLNREASRRRPSELSGGQCQRAAIARATILRPDVLICDEPVSALDVSIQAQILKLLAELRSEHGLSMLFISHDLAVVAALCDRTAVMNQGEVVERGATHEVAHNPQHPYTKLLNSSIPLLDNLFVS
ncbi:ABC transporter ATP-binding protein [Rhodococcus sp. OK302]|uniref:ABC transporter ATP-binding protein n=1 Tax=Rhodococcus sp. OK302 TaxID=1882769 RepID=UPI000B93CD9A|nr:ATP-binding cassette domain-containing protein [Rhodococcus sp. OK302]OYD61123.1 oligopeptide/dipeptide transporter [Rhodococcus sp. OK302]